MAYDYSDTLDRLAVRRYGLVVEQVEEYVPRMGSFDEVDVSFLDDGERVYDVANMR